MEKINLLILFSAALSSFGVLVVKNFWLRKQEAKDEKMLLIASRIKTGISAFIRRQYETSFKVMICVFIVLIILAMKGFISFYTPFAVFSGALFSALSAYLGLTAFTRANVVTAYLTKEGLNKSFRAALNGGAVMGFSVCGFVLLDLGIWYGLIYLLNRDLPEAELMQIVTSTVITFSFGASFMAFMARVAGGIFTKAADFAADVVGKGEFGLEEDDPRNPAVIADNVGDGVSDIAGMGQDLNESYAGGNAASMEAGFQSMVNMSILTGIVVTATQLVMLPLAVSAIGILASIIGLTTISAKSYDLKILLNSVRRGIYITSLLIIIFSGVLIYYTMPTMNLWYPIIIGLFTGNGIAFVAEYYTGSGYKPTIKLAEKAEGGHASVMVAGIALGMESVIATAVVVVVGMVTAFYSAGNGDYGIGIYGISLAAVSMLSTLPITLTIDAFGPIADNAQGIIEMSGVDGERAKIANNLDSLGNTTAATGKGYAIGSAVFAALALIGALVHVIKLSLEKLNLDTTINLEITNIWVLSGLIIGVAVPWLFSAKLLRAVNEAAFVMIHEIKRQFREVKGILTGEVEPDYQKCIDISVVASQKYSIVPAILVIAIPIVIAIIGGPSCVLSFLMGALCSGFILGVFMANAGGAWDNAKKLIEAGMLGGKHTDAHRAAITGDMVGDPFKDTAGPSLNILIKLMVTVSILTASLTMYLHSIIF